MEQTGRRRSWSIYREYPLIIRLGTTSYIKPADILPNVEFLAGQVDDIELVLFESDGFCNVPSREVVEQLAGLAARHDLTYTVHFPLDVALGSSDETKRRLSVETCLRIADRMRSLNPFGWVVHFIGDRRGREPVDDPAAWRAQLERSVADLLAGGLRAADMCVETLDYPIELVLPVIEARGLSVCLDVGHLWVGGYDVKAHWRALRERVRIVHLHGVQGKQDHLGLDVLDRDTLCGALDLFREQDGIERVVTLEIFSEEHFEQSMRVMEEFR